MTKLIVFDDGQGDLSPLNDLRAAFDIRTGALTNRERIERFVGGSCSALATPPELEGLVDAGDAAVNPDSLEGDCLLINGRCVTPAPEIKDLEPNQAMLSSGGEVVALRVDGGDALAFLETFDAPDECDSREVADVRLLHGPEDVIRHRDAAIAMDLQHMTSRGAGGAPHSSHMVGEPPVCVAAGAQVFPNVTFDAEHGPVVIDEDAVIRPGAVLCGPVYIGRGSTVLDHALIKANTAIGPRCKIAGEVGGTIFQGLANKSHDGHLGDSWVGEWANLGAGTTNSNLLNTYGEVPIRSRVDRPRRKTGLTFLGSIIGDHVKFAIGTRIMTGSVFGVGAMVACTAAPPSTVDAFAWVTDAEPQAFRLEKFLEVMDRVMARRDVRPSEAYLERLSALHLAALNRSVPGH